MEMIKCTICNSLHYDTFTFKSGHVCEDCLHYLKDEPIKQAPTHSNDIVCNQG